MIARRTLERRTQKAYLEAVNCLIRKPSITPPSVAPGARNRLDDFVATHNLQTLSIHFVGHFLPWHRYFVATYESALRKECGYTGANPYWDWNLDVPPLGKFVNSPLWDDTYGFGGNGPYIDLPNDPAIDIVPGRTGGGCVPGGPFKDMIVNIGPFANITGNPRCLARDFSPYFAGRFSGVNQTRLTLSQKDFGTFVRSMEAGIFLNDSGIHAGGHYSIGGNLGQMGDPFNSPADPLFYLHHANLDRVWWTWQKKDLSRRLTEISGPINFFDFNNQLGGNVTLDFPFSVGVNAPDVTIRDVMDIRGGALCYDYDHVYHL